MKILLLPLILTLLPIILFFLIFKFYLKKRDVSLWIKIVLGIVFFGLGLLASYFSTLVSIEGMVSENIRCVTGSIVFVPFGMILYSIGIPSIVLFFKTKDL